ncbi:hypothetical protein N7457_008571 [Penicillium paradoxum]|uniref:uncharacterized protein n=1 Tax=Penicillium paradoxum TaxID=176176 RepID=UPI002546D59F|nr:uncharacterized protein N7457_008571 [Penicillium paradoxum]KAJ5773675.1 hypothetical protein N7457_008571 [Penicillium paradoxum]
MARREICKRVTMDYMPISQRMGCFSSSASYWHLQPRRWKCSPIHLYLNTVTDGCLVEPSVEEQAGGWLPALPGCKPTQSGPNNAALKTGCGAPTEIGSPLHYYTDLTDELGWEWIGCAVDNAGAVRTLTGSSLGGSDMTVKKCISNCKAAGHTP